MSRTYTRAFSGPVGVYADGTPHVPARGRYAPRNRVEDHFTACGSVVEGFPDRADFLRQIVRELKIRFYQPSIVKNYRNAIRSFLRWFGYCDNRTRTQSASADGTRTPTRKRRR